MKTYLPDGDIDLTAFGGLCHEEELANRVCKILEMEAQNGAAQFVVKDVQLIRAEVCLFQTLMLCDVCLWCLCLPIMLIVISSSTKLSSLLQVKLVKCLVQNIVVDISFNQLGGLCTLCFLEKVICPLQYECMTMLCQTNLTKLF